jgi:hypothetical protein
MNTILVGAGTLLMLIANARVGFRRLRAGWTTPKTFDAITVALMTVAAVFLTWGMVA